MSKITFRADEGLIERLEALETSKSEALREALREYLDRHGEGTTTPRETTETADGSLDALVAERVDALVADRLGTPQDVNVNISLEGARPVETDESGADAAVEREPSHTASNESSHTTGSGKTDSGDSENASTPERNTCTQCGEILEPSHVYCPNCGEKSAHRAFCECGDELQSDWLFCPSCGKRTPAADVLDDS